MIDLLDYLFSSPLIDIFEYFLFYSRGYYEFETFVINVSSFVIEKYNESLNAEGLWYNNWKWEINSFFYYLCCERIKNFFSPPYRLRGLQVRNLYEINVPCFVI